MTLSLQDVANRFQKPKRQTNGSYKAICPCHRDKEASLSISEGKEKDKIVLHCHAGCDTANILDAVGLIMSDIGGKDKTANGWKEKIEDYLKIPLVDFYHYKDERGNYLYTKMRFLKDGSKALRYGILNKENDFMTLGRKEREPTLYNLQSLISTVRKGFPVYYVEGEKDVETLRGLGLTATTAGSVSDWRNSFAKYFTGAKLVILPDNDAPGMELAEQVRKGVRNHAHSIKVVKTSAAEKGDVTDYIVKEKHSKEELMNLMAMEPGIMAPWLYKINEGKSNEKIVINEDRLAECILKTTDYVILTEQGSGADMFYVYQNGVYQRYGKNEIKALARNRIPFGIGKDDIFNKTASLLMYSGNNIHSFDAINSNEWIINLKNGLYDLRERKLIPHSPKVLSTIQLDCTFQEQRQEPKAWNKFITDLCQDDDGKLDLQMVYMLQEWMGAVVSNIKMQRFKRALTLHSLLGNTGKSQYTAVLAALIGWENVANIPIQKMSDRWSMAEAYGKRLILVGDQSASNIDDSSVFKQITGGDPVRAEFKNKMAFSFIFNGAITFACNDLPTFQDDKGGHIFERFLLAHCRNVIPPEKRDGALLDKLLAEKDQIFLWALEGLHRLIDNGFKFTACESSDDLTKQWRNKIDSVYRFLDDTCEVTGNTKRHRIKKTEFDDEYVKYCMMNNFRSMDKRNIRDRAEKNGIQCGKVDGIWYYKGVTWKDFMCIYNPDK